MSCLQDFAEKNGLNAASFKAIGAFETATLAFFDWSSKAYLPIRVDEQTEVASFTGDIARAPRANPQYMFTRSWGGETEAPWQVI